MMRTALRLALSGALLAVATGAAHAQSDLCAGLANEMARLASLPGGGNPEVGRWDRAIRDQAIAIEQAGQRKRRAGCDGGTFLFRRADPVRCKDLDKQLRAMHAKLASMERARDKAAREGAGGSDKERRIAIIRRQMYQNNCAAPQYRAASRNRLQEDPEGNSRIRYVPSAGGRIIARVGPDTNGVVDARPAPQSRGLFSLLFGGAGGERVYGNDWGGAFAGTYRTLCVRSCDGYYFPISFSTTEENFSRDAATCSSMCPGTDARLFIHHNPGESSEAMVSLDGQPYTELETAFRYRTEYDPACTCQAQSVDEAQGLGLEGDSRLVALTMSGDDPAPIDDGGSLLVETGMLGPLAALPIAKLPFDADPDTLANARGNFDPLALVKTARAAPKPDQKLASETDRGEIRIVGPNYFVAQ